MKTIPSALQTHYDSGCTTLARLWKVTRRDATVLGFTDHDQALVFGGTTYQPTSGFDASAIASRADMAVDNLEVLGVLEAGGITAESIEAGLWDGAAIEIRQVNWADLTMGAEILRVGELGNIQRRRGQYVAELRGLQQKLQNSIIRVIAPTCDAVLGDARCGVDLGSDPDFQVTGTVTAVTNRRQFTASALALPDDWFTGGDVVFTSGANNGVRMDVKHHLSGGSVELQLPLPYDIAIGNTFTITVGCDKTKATCVAKFDNLLNFRGFSFVPGQDQALQIGGQ